jgi:hypothetical protein
VGGDIVIMAIGAMNKRVYPEYTVDLNFSPGLQIGEVVRKRELIDLI